MAHPFLPLLLEPAELEKHLGAENLLVVDMNPPDVYNKAHIPGAVHLDYAQIVAAQPPAMGALPSEAQLSEVFSAIGMTPNSHVVAYDNEGNGRAARLLWTLDAVGHPHFSLLNGGLPAWLEENRPVSGEPVKKPRSEYQAKLSGTAVADKDYILGHLQDQAVALLDTRSPGEYSGAVKRAARGGHIPGAVNFDWVNAMDSNRNLRLRDAKTLRTELTRLGVIPDKEVITYCQTHHRSAHTYIVLKALGFTNIKGYPGSWSEWGNCDDTPIE